MKRRSPHLTAIAAVLALVVTILGVGASGERAEAALPPGGTFSDDNANTHEGSIEALYAAGVTKGCSADGTKYCPSSGVTRAEMAAFLLSALGASPAPSHNGYFPDVGANAWYAPYVERIYEMGIAVGFEDGSFRPNTIVTRAEMSVLLVNAFQTLEVVDTARSFSDISDTAWYAPYAEGLLVGGVTAGCKNSPLSFCPTAPVLRDQMATFLARALGLEPIIPPPAPYQGPALPELHVNNAASNASDANSGTQAEPLATIQAAVDRSKTARQDGQNVRIVVHPGVYREWVRVGNAGSNPPPLVIEATQPGTAIVTGSDLWTGWTLDSGTNAYVHSWPHDWGQASGVAPIVGRREMVFINGQRMTQVLSKTELAPNTFYVDEGANQLYVRGSGSVSSAEVAVRERTLTVDGARNTTVRGLVFKHAASSFDHSSVYLVNGGNNLFEGNVVTDNNWGGVQVSTATGVTMSNNVINANGGSGIGVFKAPGLLMDSNTTSYNNWRGVRGDYTGWSIAAVKMVGEQDAVVRNHTSIGNFTRGFWVDYDIRNVSISGSVFSDNLTDGLFVEAAPGPVSITNTVMSGNGRYGLLVVNTLSTSVTNSRMCFNAKSAIRIDSEPGGRTVESSSGNVWIPAAKDLKLQGNTFGRSERLMDANVPSDHWSTFVGTLTSGGNTWVPIDPGTAFVYRGQKTDLGAWQSATGQDTTSTVSSSGC